MFVLMLITQKNWRFAECHRCTTHSVSPTVACDAHFTHNILNALTVHVWLKICGHTSVRPRHLWTAMELQYTVINLVVLWNSRVDNLIWMIFFPTIFSISIFHFFFLSFALWLDDRITVPCSTGINAWLLWWNEAGLATSSAGVLVELVASLLSWAPGLTSQVKKRRRGASQGRQDKLTRYKCS